jgi:hypothetical protein
MIRSCAAVTEMETCQIWDLVGGPPQQKPLVPVLGCSVARRISGRPHVIFSEGPSRNGKANG